MAESSSSSSSSSSRSSRGKGGQKNIGLKAVCALVVVLLLVWFLTRGGSDDDPPALGSTHSDSGNSDSGKDTSSKSSTSASRNKNSENGESRESNESSKSIKSSKPVDPAVHWARNFKPGDVVQVKPTLYDYAEKRLSWATIVSVEEDRTCQLEFFDKTSDDAAEQIHSKRHLDELESLRVPPEQIQKIQSLCTEDCKGDKQKKCKALYTSSTKLEDEAAVLEYGYVLRANKWEKCAGQKIHMLVLKYEGEEIENDKHIQSSLVKEFWVRSTEKVDKFADKVAEMLENADFDHVVDGSALSIGLFKSQSSNKEELVPIWEGTQTESFSKIFRGNPKAYYGKQFLHTGIVTYSKPLFHQLKDTAMTMWSKTEKVRSIWPIWSFVSSMAGIDPTLGAAGHAQRLAEAVKQKIGGAPAEAVPLQSGGGAPAESTPQEVDNPAEGKIQEESDDDGVAIPFILGFGILAMLIYKFVKIQTISARTPDSYLELKEDSIEIL